MTLQPTPSIKGLSLNANFTDIPVPLVRISVIR